MTTRRYPEDMAETTKSGVAPVPAQASIEAPANDSQDKKAMSVIGADIVITGNIEASVDLQIEGKVEGDVRCATLILGETSLIKGRVFATRVKVSGTVEGAVDTRDLAVEATGTVSGEITYSRLRVSNGGSIDGKLNRKPLDDAAEEGARLKLVEKSAPGSATAD
jgi:cytoskeletal protein CcmA (bactofilin family)